jgi:hypothetical protein
MDSRIVQSFLRKLLSTQGFGAAAASAHEGQAPLGVSLLSTEGLAKCCWFRRPAHVHVRFRWQGKHLSYYSDSKYTTEPVHLDLTDCNVAVRPSSCIARLIRPRISPKRQEAPSDKDESGLEMKWCFSVTPKNEGDRAWTLCTESKEERRIWMLRVTTQVRQRSLDAASPSRPRTNRRGTRFVTTIRRAGRQASRSYAKAARTQEIA